MGVGREHLPLDEVVERRDGRPVEHGTARDAEQGGVGQELGRRSPRGVLVHGREELVPALHAPRRRGEVGVLHHVGATDQEAEVLVLLRAVGREHRVAVGGRPRSTAPRRCGRCRGSPASRGRTRTTDGTAGGGGHAVEHRHVDHLAPPRGLGGPEGGERAHRGVGARDPLAQPAARGQRLGLRPPLMPRRPGAGLEGELGRGQPDQGPSAPKGVIVTTTNLGLRPGPARRRSARRSPAGRRPPPGLDLDDRALRRSGSRRARWIASAAERVTTGRLDPDDVRPGVGEQLGAVRPGDVAGAVEDARMGQHHGAVSEVRAADGRGWVALLSDGAAGSGS